MKKIRITEKQLRNILGESVYINRDTVNNKKKTFNLSYVKSNYSRGNYNRQDMLKTDKMDNGLGSDTYEIPLKGGIMSYNITSINGSAVMHYFKNYFDREKTEIDVKTDNGTEKYTLLMQDAEFRQFINQFAEKVNAVIAYQLKKMNTNIERVSIYPVPSSHNFNKAMAAIMAEYNLGNLPCQVINENLFVKDLRNLERDEDFIKKNKEFYEGSYSENDNASVNSKLNDSIKRAYLMQTKLKPYIDQMNQYEKMILSTLSNYKVSNSQKTLNALVSRYKMYYDLWAECKKIAVYDNKKIQGSKIAKQKAYSKAPSIELRSKYIWNLVAPFLNNVKSPITGNYYEATDIQEWDFNDFEIKNLSNGERMGMKNIYNPNLNPELIEQELEKIKGTAFVIFDDNVSGGATLSDICYQCKQLGIENIIPITFGKMAVKWQLGPMQINRPRNSQGEIGKFNLSEIRKMVYESINNALKPDLTILWLDDMRDPNKYFAKKITKSEGTLYNNVNFYDSIFKKSNVKFIWVKSFNEFTNFIETNGLPEFVSFDHDLGKGLPKGLDCAKWLVEYCRKNNLNLPNYYVHSANPNGQKEINGLLKQF